MKMSTKHTTRFHTAAADGEGGSKIQLVQSLIYKTAYRMYLGPSPFDSAPQTPPDMKFSFLGENFPFRLDNKMGRASIVVKTVLYFGVEHPYSRHVDIPQAVWTVLRYTHMSGIRVLQHVTLSSDYGLENRYKPVQPLHYFSVSNTTLP